jgi:hypothetical protein
MVRLVVLSVILSFLSISYTCHLVPSVIHMSDLKPSFAYVTSVTSAHMEEGVSSVDHQVCFTYTLTT